MDLGCFVAGENACLDQLAFEAEDRVARVASPATSSEDRYFDWVCRDECEYGRVTIAWIRQGPSPAGTRAVASEASHLDAKVVSAVDLVDRQAAQAPNAARRRVPVPARRPEPRWPIRCPRRGTRSGGAAGRPC